MSHPPNLEDKMRGVGYLVLIALGATVVAIIGGALVQLGLQLL